MAADRIVEMRDIGEFRQTLAAKPPAFVHGTAVLLMLLIGGAITWASLTEANVVVRGPARVRPADAPLKTFEEESNEQVFSEATGRIVAIEVHEGQQIARGAILVHLDTAKISNEIDRLTSELDADKAELDAIDQMVALLGTQFDASRKRSDAEIHRAASAVGHSRQRATSEERLAKVELDDATQELARAQDLVDQKAGPAADVASATARVQRAREKMAAARIGVDDGEPEVLRRAQDQAKRDHDVKVGDLIRQRAAKQGELAAARKQLANLELERDHATLVAHRPGIVTLGGLAVGDVITAGKLPLAIIEQGDLRIDAAISTADVAQLRIGMRVRAKLDALEFQRYGTADGVITHIAADTTQVAGTRAYYLVSVALDSAELGRAELHGHLKPGMTGELEVITDRQPLISLLARTIRGAISL